MTDPLVRPWQQPRATVLVVDDDPEIRRLLRLYLEREGHRALEAADGHAAFAQAATESLDLVLLDVMLPGVDGLEICRRLRDASDTPIMLLTARSGDADKVLGLDLGADDYVVKPFSPRELMARVRAQLRRRRLPAPPAPVLSGDGLVVDPNAMEVALDGARLPLTATEFRLLYTLMGRPSRVFTRDELIDAVHGGDDPGIVAAVRWFSTEQIAHLLMEGVESEAEAHAMVDEYLGRVVVIGAVAGVVLGAVTAWWLVRRVLRPLEALRDGTRRVASGDLTARVAEPSDRELRDVARDFNAMAATLERAEALRRALVEDVAHELRTPLTTLRGYTEALADGVVEPTPEMLRTVHAEIERLTRLIEALDRLARDQHATVARARDEVDLGELVRRTLSLAEPQLRSRRIRVRIEQGADVPALMADPDGIGQVLTNLVDNAARYTDDGGEITVELRRDGASLERAIANTGTAIPDDELPLIWERLHRVDRSRSRATGGAGIGLAVVRQIVADHGGQVGAASGDGRTRIWFRLPIGA